MYKQRQAGKDRDLNEAKKNTRGKSEKQQNSEKRSKHSQEKSRNKISNILGQIKIRKGK